MHAAQAVDHARYSSHFITTQQILEHTQEMFCNLSCFCCTFSGPLTNPWQPAAVPVVFPGVNTGGVGSYVYDKEASAVTHPWTLLVPSALSLFSALHWPSTTVYLAVFPFLPSPAFVPENTSPPLQIPCHHVSDPLPADLATRRTISNSLVMCAPAPGEPSAQPFTVH